MLRTFLFNKPIMSSMKAGFSSKGCPNVAVILAGAGVNDGSEIHEAVSMLSHLHRNGASLRCFAPDIKQMHVIDHSKGKEEDGQRNVLAESARISRGEISPINDLICNQNDYHAVVIPGGFGVAKNLSDFAVKGAQMSVNKDVANVICTFHKNQKPIGLCCIAPILAAKLIPGVTITLGKSSGDDWPFKDAIEAAQSMGAKTEEKNVDEVSVDCKNHVYSTPAFMYGAGTFDQIDDGIGNMIKALVQSLK